MANLLVVANLGDSKQDAVVTAPVGTETLDASVPAEGIAIYLNDTPLRSGDIDRLINQLKDVLRESGYAA